MARLERDQQMSRSEWNQVYDRAVDTVLHGGFGRYQGVTPAEVQAANLVDIQPESPDAEETVEIGGTKITCGRMQDTRARSPFFCACASAGGPASPPLPLALPLSTRTH